MNTENGKKNAGYLNIVSVLRKLRDRGIITPDEYMKAKVYYANLTGADIVLAG